MGDVVEFPQRLRLPLANLQARTNMHLESSAIIAGLSINAGGSKDE
jgi:hypothetical protein